MRPASALRADDRALPPLTAIPRQLVHKDTQAEVLLCGWQQDGDDTFAIPAQWPRSHTFYHPAHELYDPMLFAESVRQAIPLVSHVGYGAPMDNRQIWDHFRCTIFPEALHRGPRPADCDLRLTCTDVVRRAGRLGRTTMQATAVRGGQRVGIAETRFSNHTPAIYRRLRGPRCEIARATEHAVALPAPLAPDEVGRINPQDVVLAPGGSHRRSQLRVDTTHPVLFDHPVDHVPGMILLEAARQAAHSALRPDPTVMTGIDARFTQFVEFDAPCWIEAHPAATSADGHRTVHITARQGDVIPFTATVTAVVVAR
ncbi:ScbA/BarX family gamma-butyrolactone biosynthesis protein [Streptomyces fuscigenes]|uniref:ScbA/BarX family gamma-butyrolactone biosynthesis protein n=1 Tax=Streptomyces fuscigenes TaxID=1528880 RepID=UPI001F3CF364|nr:ScbA/BarX family gamma-butyrolactone biosynthesis protein [Streptomyces fuscigenes]MCF3960174.1 transcriptional regulator [Streptomyces fuscigenes]